MGEGVGEMAGVTRAPAAPASALAGHRSVPWRASWLYAAVWLIFLVPAVLDGLHDQNRPRGWAGAALVVGFSAFYLRTWATVRTRRIRGTLAEWRWRWWVFGLATATVVASVLLVGQSALSMATFLTVLVMMLLPPRARLAVTGLIVLATAGAVLLVPGWDHDLGALVGVLLTAFIMWGIVQMMERNAELARAHERLAELAVAEERARFARDLHDLLGHSLTLLAMKAELAGRLVRLDAARAEQEISDVERLARDALVDVRAAVGGYRQVNLTGELVSARAVLDAAGIDAELPVAVDAVPGDRRELLGWAVREGVTNVVRHSGATRCRIVGDRDAGDILDDGRGPGPAPAAGGESWTLGSGLRGLRERAEVAGATVLVGSASDGGFRLRVGW